MMRPSLLQFFALEIRGRRECRVHAAPAVSCANSAQKTHTSIQVQTEHSDIPCAMALRLMPRSPRRRIRLVTVADGLTVDRKPGWVRTTSASLTPATGARTTRFCRTLQRRSSCAPCSLTGSALRHVSRDDAAASTATCPNVRDDGQRPSERDRIAGVIVLICPTAKAEYFCAKVWTDFWTDLPVGQL